MSDGSKNQTQTEEFENLPKIIGAYEIKEKINEGGFSKIYLGLSRYTNDKVAIKIINKYSFQKNPDDLILIRNEINVLKILKHRNILTLYEIFESSQYIFIVTEYLPTELSSLIISKKRFNETDALKIFIQLIDAFQYMHKLQIIHRDFRLEHIMLDSNNIPKIIDFGFSNFYKKGEELEEYLGSISYSCPEIIQEKPYDPELADVWSLGVCLYVLVCGYLPFSEEDDNKNKELIISGKIDYPNDIGNICKDLLKKMLEVNTKKRLNLLKISRHPWIKGCKDFKIIGGYNTYDMIYPIDERLLKIITEFGIDTKKLEEDLNNNKFNKTTGLFKILTKKGISLGYGTISDFTSNAFLEYMKKKDKIKSDGEAKYKEFLENINKKNDELKKIVSDYKTKQKEVIKKLDEIKSESENNRGEKEDNKTKEINKEEKKEKKENTELKEENKEENKEIKEVKNETNSEKKEKKEEDEVKEEEKDENEDKKEMRFSLSFDDDEDKEKSDNDNDENKNDEEKSNNSNESKEKEKEISIKEEIEKEEKKEEKKEVNMKEKEKEKEKPAEIQEKEEIKEIPKTKEKKIINIEKDLYDCKRIIINNDCFNNNILDIENARIKIEEKREQEKKEQEKREQERIEQEKREQEKRELEKKEQERIEQEKREQEKKEQEKREQEKKELEKKEQQRIEKEKKELEKKEKERIEKEKKDKEKKDKEKDKIIQNKENNDNNKIPLKQNVQENEIKKETENKKEIINQIPESLEKDGINKNESIQESPKLEINKKEKLNNNKDINKNKENISPRIESDEIFIEEKEIKSPDNTKDILRSKKNDINIKNNENEIPNYNKTKEKKEEILKKEKSKEKKESKEKRKEKKFKDSKINAKKNKEKKEKIKENSKSKEHKSENNIDIKDKKYKNDNSDKNIKNVQDEENNGKKEKSNVSNIIGKKEDNLKYLVPNSKKINNKNKEKSNLETDKIIQEVKYNINNINDNIIETKNDILFDKKDDTETESNLLRNYKINNKKKKLKDKSKKENKENKEINNLDINEKKEIIESKNITHNKKKKISKYNDNKKEEKGVTKEGEKEKEKEIERKRESEIEKEKDEGKRKNNRLKNYNYIGKRKIDVDKKIDLDKKLQQKLNNIEKEKINSPREKNKKSETINHKKEKKSNKSRQKSKSRARKKTPSKSSDKNKDYYQSILNSQKIRTKTDENGEYNMNMSNISRSLSLKRAKKKNYSNEDLNKDQKEILSYRHHNSDNNALSINHVNDINYLGENNNYFYLKNRVIRFNNQNINNINGNKEKEEYKANNEYYKNNKDNEYIGYNLYLNSESNEKRKLFFSINNENDKDLEIRQRRLEKQKNKLKEELRKSGNTNYFFKKNTNPINIKIKKQKNIDNDLEDKKPKIKIVNKIHNHNNNKHKINERKTILLNKKKKYNKNFNEEYFKMNSLNNVNNDEYPKEFPSPISVNTKFKEDPLKFITQYFLYKNEPNKITNNREAKEDDNNPDYNRYKNINLLDILKLINESKKNNLEKKLKKFKGKSKNENENNNNNNDISLSNTYYNQNLKSINFITEYNQNNSFTMVNPNNLNQKSNNYTSGKKQGKKRIISLIDKQKIKDCFYDNIKNGNSKDKINKIYNKTSRDNISMENKKASSSINWRYDSHKSNSINKKMKKVNFN